MCEPRHLDVTSVRVPFVPRRNEVDDVIGVRIVETPRHYGSHRMGMT